MLKVNGDFSGVKAEMKETVKLQKERIKQLKKRSKKEKAPLTGAERMNIEKLEYSLKMYAHSNVLPVRVEGITINYKLFAAFIKKIENFNTSVAVLDDGLVVQYWRKGTLHQGKGVLKLYDISEYYKDFETIPTATIPEFQYGQKA